VEEADGLDARGISGALYERAFVWDCLRVSEEGVGVWDTHWVVSVVLITGLVWIHFIIISSMHTPAITLPFLVRDTLYLLCSLEGRASIGFGRLEERFSSFHWAAYTAYVVVLLGWEVAYSFILEHRARL